jgi:orotate phosphoribosyltransferase
MGIVPPEGTMRNLTDLLLELSVKTGDFTLKSGRKSDLYVDVRMTALHDEGARVIALAVLDRLLPEVQAVGGVELGAVPIVGSVLAVEHYCDEITEREIPGFVVRKAPKGHGTARRIENCPPAGTKVAIIEDVTTTGGSLLAAIQAAQEAGLEVVQAITVVDRLEGARELLEARGYTGTFTALVSRKDLLGE